MTQTTERAPLDLTPDLLAIPQKTAVKLAGRALAGMIEELVSVGNLALCEAARKFDPGRGLKPITYLLPCVRGAMLQYLDSRALRDNGRWYRRVRCLGDMAGGRAKAFSFADRSPPPEDVLLRREEEELAKEEVRRTLARCHAADREYLWMHLGLEMTYDQIGAVKGCSHERVRQRIARARAMIAGEGGKRPQPRQRRAEA